MKGSLQYYLYRLFLVKSLIYIFNKKNARIKKKPDFFC